MRRSLAAGAAAVAFAGAAGRADAASFVVFEPTEAEPGDVVTLRLDGTVATPGPPRGDAIRVFLVPNYAAPDVRSAGDRRLTYVATIEPDANGNGVASFEVPDLAPGLYAAAFESKGTVSAVDAETADVAPAFRGRIGLTVRSGRSSWLWPVGVGVVIAVAAALAFGRRRRGRGAA